MVCPKCKSNLEPDATFCSVCGERTDKIHRQNGGKMRKEYNTSVYIILDLFGGGFLFGINDFYAGYITVGLLRLLSTMTGLILAISTSSPYFLFFPGVSSLIGLIEIYGVFKKAYAHENGVLLIRPLDLIYDRKGTENLFRTKYGCELPIKTRKEFNTGVYIVLWLFLGGWAFATNDFYAGYIKFAVFRIALFVFGAILGSAAHLIFLEYVFIGVSILAGIIELLLVGEKKYSLENGNLALIRPLDLIYDRESTNALIIKKYGCGLTK